MQYTLSNCAAIYYSHNVQKQSRSKNKFNDPTSADQLFYYLCMQQDTVLSHEFYDRFLLLKKYSNIT